MRNLVHEVALEQDNDAVGHLLPNNRSQAAGWNTELQHKVL